MRPSSVCLPTPVVIAVALPYVTNEPEKTMFRWSPKAIFSSYRVQTSFSAFSDSPVRALSFVFKEKFSINSEEAKKFLANESVACTLVAEDKKTGKANLKMKINGDYVNFEEVKDKK